MAKASTKSCYDYEDDFAISYPPQPPPIKGRHIYNIAYATSLSDFTIVTAEKYYDLTGYSNDMEQIYIAKPYALHESLVGVDFPVAARYVGDGNAGDARWYRAKVLSFDGESKKYKIEFVDYGNVQHNELRQLRGLTMKYGNMPPLAYRCRLWKTDGLVIPSEINTKFLHLIFTDQWSKGRVIVDVLTDDKPPYIIRVWNIETGVELTPDMMGVVVPPKPVPLPLHSSATSLVPVSSVVAVVVPSVGESKKTGAIKKTTIQQPKCINSPNNVAQQADASTSGFMNGHASGVDLLGDLVQEMKEKCNLRNVPSLITVEHFRRQPLTVASPSVKAKASPEPVVKNPTRDSTTQTLVVAKPAPQIKNGKLTAHEILAEDFPQLDDVLKNGVPSVLNNFV